MIPVILKMKREDCSNFNSLFIEKSNAKISANKNVAIKMREASVLKKISFIVLFPFVE